MSGSRQQAVIVVLFLALVLAWLVLDQVGPTNPVRDSVSQVLSPLQYVMQRIAQPAFQAGRWFGRLRDLQAENDALRAENATLRNQIMLLNEAEIENRTLREQLNFQSSAPSLELLSGEVIGHDPSNLMQYLIIDRGAQDGLRKGMPVLTAAGLVGRLSEVSLTSSKVMLLTDPSSSVSALIQRSRATGLAQGHASNALILRYIPMGETVQVGDVVLTSGLGGNFPRRLVIGQIASVESSDAAMFQEARIVPAVRLRDLETVMVLLNFTPTDLQPEPGGG